MKRLHLYVLTIAVLLASGCSGNAGKENNVNAASTAAPSEIRVKTVAAEERTVERAIAVTGSLLPDETVTLSAEVPGRVVRIGYDFGQNVRKGDVLVELDSTEYALQIEKARGALNQTLARLGLPAYTGKTVMPKETPALRQAAAQLDDAKFKYESATRLVKTGDVAQDRFNELEKGYRARQAAVDAARDEMRTVWASVSALEADLKIAEKRRNDTVVRAPFDGEIAEKQTAIGQYVKDNTPLVRLVKTNPLRLRVEVPEAAANMVRLGSQLMFTTDALAGAEFAAVVRELNPSLDTRSRTLTVEARMTRADRRLRPGMFVQVRLVTEGKSKIVAVPKQAVYSVAGLTKAFIIRDGTAQQVTFVPGMEMSGWVEVPNGSVKQGDRVAITELGALITGTKVRTYPHAATR